MKRELKEEVWYLINTKTGELKFFLDEQSAYSFYHKKKGFHQIIPKWEAPKKILIK